MPSFGQASQQRLNSCHTDLAVIFNEVVKTFDCSVVCGHRTKSEQDKVYPRYSQVQWPKSKHNSLPSIAVDVIPYPVDWQDIKRFYLFGGYVLATARHLYDAGLVSHRLRWGGDWDVDTEVTDQKFNDLPHFELIGVK